MHPCPQCALIALGRFLAPQCALVAHGQDCFQGGISGLGVADPASDSDLPPDVGADDELLVAEGSASFSGLSRHGMAEPGCLDVDLPPDTDIVLNAWDDVTDEVDEVVGPLGPRTCAGQETTQCRAQQKHCF